MDYDPGSDSWALLDDHQRKLNSRRWTKWEKGRSDKKFFRRGLCSFCQTHHATTLDHIIPRNRQGGEVRNDPMNWTAACYECNQKKGDRHFLFFYAWRQDVVVQGIPFRDRVTW